MQLLRKYISLLKKSRTILTENSLATPWITELMQSSRNSHYVEDDENLFTGIVRENSVSSSMSLGDTHVWRENNNNA